MTPQAAAAEQALAGVRVVVTRAEHQAPALAGLLERAGATVELLPLLAVLPPDDGEPLARAAGALDRYDWAVFTSSNAVAALLDRVPGAWPGRLAVAAVGPATALALGRRGIRPAVVAKSPRAEGLLAELLPRLAPGTRVLLPQAADARPVLAAGLREAGVAVDAVVAYRKGCPGDAAARAGALFHAGPLGWVTFTSPAVVRTFAGLFTGDWPRRRPTLRAASIGPVTSDALRAAGVEPAAEAPRPADAELVAAIAAAHAAGSA